MSPLADQQWYQQTLAFATVAHEGQTRKSGEPYIIHPIAVAKRLWDLYHDQALTQAALLHDTIEDTEVTQEQIDELFGKEVGVLVDAVTKTPQTKSSVMKYLTAGLSDVRPILLKLADREHNINTLCSLPQDRQVRMSFETQVLFHPLVAILGYGTPDMTVAVSNQQWQAYLTEHDLRTAEQIWRHFLTQSALAAFQEEFYEQVCEYPHLIVWELEDEEDFYELMEDEKFSGSVELKRVRVSAEEFLAQFQVVSGELPEKVRPGGFSIPISPSR